MSHFIYSMTDVALDHKLKQTLGRHGGIVRELMSFTPDPGDPQVVLSMALPANPKELDDQIEGLIEFIASGIGETEEEANNSAVGEAIERYCAAYVQRNRICFAAGEELSKNKNVLNPEEYPLFTEEQYAQWSFPYRPFTSEDILGWVQGRNYTNNQEVFVPAGLVWDSYRPLHPKEPFLSYGLMTGSACGQTIEDAVMSGLLEIIERDSFMIMWYNSLSMPKINVEGFTKAKEMFAGFFDEARFQLDLVNTTTDTGIPSVFGVLRTYDNKVLIGGAARLTMEEAVIKTLSEIAQLYMGNKYYIYNPHVSFLTPEQVTDFSLRFPYYLQEEAQEELAFTYVSAAVQSYREHENVFAGLNTTKAKLEKTIAMLKQVGLEVLVVDITSDEVKELGLSVAKVIVPGAVQLPRSEKERIITTERIYEVPIKLGYLHHRKEPDELNPSPHPFP